MVLRSRAEAGVADGATPERWDGAQGDHPQPQPEREVHGLRRPRRAGDEVLGRRHHGRRRRGDRAEAGVATAPPRARRRCRGARPRCRRQEGTGAAEAVGGAVGDEPAPADGGVGVPGAARGGGGARVGAQGNARARRWWRRAVPVVPLRGALRLDQPLLRRFNYSPNVNLTILRRRNQPSFLASSQRT